MLLFQSLSSSTEQSRCIRSDVLAVFYYFSLLVPILNCKDASAIDVLGVCYYFILSVLVLNCPDASSSDVLGIFYYFLLSVPVLNSLADPWYGL